MHQRYKKTKSFNFLFYIRRKKRIFSEKFRRKNFLLELRLSGITT